MRIFLLSPIYAITTQGSGATPVVHYFAKEWVKQGHEVYVYNLRAQFPEIFYWVGKRYQHKLNSRLGMLIPTEKPIENEFEHDGVVVKRVCLKKLMPHSEASCRQIHRALGIIAADCKKYGVPDIFIGHWDNPCIEFLLRLKEKYSRPIAIVLHENTFTLKERFGEAVVDKLALMDYIGFRNPSAQIDFESKYFKPQKSFIAHSGVSQIFIDEGIEYTPSFDNPIKDFIFVGSLIQRKYPMSIVTSVYNSYGAADFQITYVGDGDERYKVENACDALNISDKVYFTGRIPRESIIDHLKRHQIFVMISKSEIFGLVYLEAMALGLIPIGSRGEGIDGIIVDGKNGFLCEPGNEKELTEIINRIRYMSTEELRTISNNAKKTALSYSDSKVAERYINAISH